VWGEGAGRGGAGREVRERGRGNFLPPSARFTHLSALPSQSHRQLTVRSPRRARRPAASASRASPACRSNRRCAPTAWPAARSWGGFFDSALRPPFPPPSHSLPSSRSRSPPPSPPRSVHSDESARWRTTTRPPSRCVRAAAPPAAEQRRRRERKTAGLSSSSECTAHRSQRRGPASWPASMGPGDCRHPGAGRAARAASPGGWWTVPRATCSAAGLLQGPLSSEAWRALRRCRGRPRRPVSCSRRTGPNAAARAGAGAHSAGLRRHDCRRAPSSCEEPPRHLTLVTLLPSPSPHPHPARSKRRSSASASSRSSPTAGWTSRSSWTWATPR
jgi:hypothetical protein